MAREQRGFTLVELAAVCAILLVLAALASSRYQTYTYRTRAASLVVEAQPIQRAIQVAYRAPDQTAVYQLANASDGSIVGCQAPRGTACDGRGAGPTELVVPADKLVLAGGTVRAMAALCETDCPGYALTFTADPSATGTAPSVPPPASSPATGTTPSTPASPPPSSTGTASPASPPSSSTGAAPSAPPSEPASKGKGNDKGGGKGKGASIVPWPVSSAYAQSADFEQTNRVLYEFGEVMRRNVHSADNAACLLAGSPCSVTIKY